MLYTHFTSSFIFQFGLFVFFFIRYLFNLSNYTVVLKFGVYVLPFYKQKDSSEKKEAGREKVASSRELTLPTVVYVPNYSFFPPTHPTPEINNPRCIPLLLTLGWNDCWKRFLAFVHQCFPSMILRTIHVLCKQRGGWVGLEKW